MTITVQSWDDLSSSLVKDLFFSTSKDRFRSFHKLHVYVENISDPSDKSLITIQAILVSYFNHLSDSKKSIIESANLLERIFDLNNSFLSSFVNAIVKVSSKGKSVAYSDLNILSSWINLIISKYSTSGKFDELIPTLITAQLQIFDSLTYQIDPTDTHKERIRNLIMKSSTAALRKLSIDQTSLYLKSAIASKASIDSINALINALSVNDLAEDNVKQIIDYYIKIVLASKAPLNNPSGLNDFFDKFIEKPSLDSTIIPALEKAVVRSSELSLAFALPLFTSLSSSFDLPESLAKSKLLNQLVTGLKNSKETVRDLSLKILLIIIKTTSTEQSLAKLCDELLKTVKTVTAADQKASYYKVLFSIPSNIESISIKIYSSLLPLVAKDQNEVSLNAGLNAFFVHLFSAVSNDWTVSKETKDSLLKGFKEAKIQLRKLWFENFGLGVNSIELNDKLTSFIVEVFPTMVLGFEDILANPTNNIKGINVSYVTLFVANLIRNSADVSSVFEKALQNTDRPSILINSRVYSKLSTSEDYAWFINALLASSTSIKEDSLDLGKAWISFILSRLSSPEARQLNVQSLEKAYALNQKIIGDSIVKAVYDVLLNKTIEDEFTSTYIYSRIASVLHTFTTRTLDFDILKEQLSKIIISAHHESLPLNFSWVQLSLKADLDPGSIVKEYGDLMIKQIADVLINADKKTIFSGIFKSAATAAATSAFIDPIVVAPVIKNIIDEDFNLQPLKELSNQEIEIWKAEEGELVVNVLESSKKAVENKNTKDYETRKWEESLKKEISKKNQANKKYTKEEQEQINQQLAKESAIRGSVTKIVNSLNRSIQIINALCINGDVLENGKTKWVSSAVDGLLKIITLPVTNQLIGSSPTDAFLNLSSVVSSRLSQMRFFIGIAILRIKNIGVLDDSFKHENILDLVSRVLFKVKFSSDQQPYDLITLTYLLPLLATVLEQGKIKSIQNAKKPVTNSEFIEEDKEEEQLLLALEIISNHAEEFKNPAIPRSHIFNVLLSLLALPTKAKLAKDCLLTLCQYVSIDFTTADLKLLFSGLLAPESFVRNTILEALDQEFDLSELSYADEVWIGCHDNDDTNAELALTIWEENQFNVSLDSIRTLYPFLDQNDSGLRLSVGKALADAIQIVSREDESQFSVIIDELLNLYSEKSRPPEPILDRFGLVIKSSHEQKDLWEARSGIAIVFKLVAALFTSTDLVYKFVEFIIDEKALADKEVIVSEEFKEAAVAIIEQHGKENVETLIPIFEKALAAAKTTESTGEVIKENVVIIYGALARHLLSDDPRLTVMVERLLKTLQSSSEKVQRAIADVIAPLVALFKPKVGIYVDDLFKKVFTSPNRGARRGAAFGIAGLIRGYGISAVAEFDVLRHLNDAADDKKDPIRRESVAVVFECLSTCVGKFFEPYIIEILPLLLKSLGDSVPEVRDAAAQAAKVIMSNTTSYGVKKLIPLAIENLDEIAWRSKKGSVELLGSMAYLDPTQLSASLSTIVPEIVGVLNDSHKEVRKAADQSLKRFGDVIRNPEIHVLVPVLINAIGDPAKYTEEALDSLIKTQFVHYIDGPSLALIIHVIHRGMKDRSANTKRKACQIVGNMAILVDSKDLLPYLHQLIEELEIAMVDPVANTRATAARALGSLVEKLGEEQFPGLIPKLIATLSDESKSGDRLGSAQALAEVVSGLGISKLEELLPIILKGATSPRSASRAGFLPLLLFLPVGFGSQFAPYISQIIPAILNGLADTDESIRGTALKSGRLIVKNYASKAVDLLLPELESGLLDVNYRIRLSSVELTGDLLFQITGLSGKMELEEESEASGAVNTRLIDVLGQDRRDRVLSLLFICRSDTALVVRNAAVDIWKALVANTPRTIKEILSSLTNIIVRRLSNSDETQRTIAAQTLGDLVRRVGANALSQLLPTLQESLKSSDNDAKQGICIAVHELLESTSEATIIQYQDIFVDIIRTALISSSESVREAAAASFDSFQTVVGKVAIDEVIPYLLNMLQSDDSASALLALQEIMTTKSEVIFPILIPTLLESPIDAFRANALGSMSEVAGKALIRRLTTVINALVAELIRKDLDPTTEEALKNSFDKIVLSVEDNEGLHPLLQQLLSLIKGDDPAIRAVVYERLAPFFNETRLDYTIYTQDIVTQCILSLDDKDEQVVKNDIIALTAIVKNQSKESLERLVKPSRQTLSLVGIAGQDLYAFSLPKGPNSILPIFLHGLMYGSSDQRESSAMAIADLVSKTPSSNLKPLVTLITGPLIRVIGERFSSDIKSAILFALSMLFEKVPQFLRPFIPQLQRTFVKSLSDASNETLRLRAAKALGSLIEYQARVDPLVSELTLGAKNAENIGVKTAMLKALLEVINKAGEKLSESSKHGILDLVEKEILEADDKLAVAYARLVGSLSRILTTEEAKKILKTKVLDSSIENNDSAKFSILTLNAFLRDAPAHIFNTGLLPLIVQNLIDSSNNPNAYISDNATVAIGKLLLLNDCSKSPFIKEVSEEPFEIPYPLISDLSKQLSIITLKPVSNSLDTRRLALVVIRTVSRLQPGLFIPNLNDVAPSVFSCVRDVIIPIKLAAEKAYLSLFNLVEDKDLETFNKWLNSISDNSATTIDNVVGGTIQLRSIGDYTRRVGVRLAGVERERIEAGGDEETLYSDRIEDEGEIWAIGGVDLTKA